MKIDWYKHYKERKRLVYNKDLFKANLELDKPYLKLIKKYTYQNAKILECGCGPARTAISIAYEGFDVTAIDISPAILSFAKENAKVAEVKISFIEMDFMEIDKRFNRDSFDCITHQGVLEHFDEVQIKRIIKKQLLISPIIVFSVPIDTEFNKGKYFQDKIYRNLWSEKIWKERILKEFNIIETKVLRQRSDNLLCVIRRR